MAYSAGWEPGKNDSIADVDGIRVGHWTDRRGGTGCTVVLCETSAYAAVDARGGAPGTRETETLNTANVARTCHAILLTGGSAFGLAAADGVMEWLAERDVGFPTTLRKVPIVPGAVLFDLGLGSPTAAPGPEAGYLAAKRAKGGRVTEGSVGAGTGATLAKLLGPERCLKGGIGTASLRGPKGIVVGAIVATNPVGMVMDPGTGKVVAAPRGDIPGRFVPLEKATRGRTAAMDQLLQNTTLVCVATNADLAHHQVQRVAYQAHDGIARTILPAHTFGDGDIAFAVAMGTLAVEAHDAFTVGLMAVLAVERAILRSVAAATGLHGVPSAAEWRGLATGSSRS